ncbi:MAG: AarF/ABC1/UbiB kinase family protein [Hyphomonadaceae bacterium]|nr:AarF/ABC1/UbiB kinase family protein [Hyphomonadaceae bacterium]
MADDPDKDPERNRLTARAGRFASVGVSAAGAAASAGFSALFGGDAADKQIAAAMKAALGRTKGPLMKVAQMMATIPDFLPPEFAEEFSKLQMNAPSMGWPFVQRRMRGELGPEWETKFQSFEREAVAAASLGQVHRAVLPDGRAVACKLQYPEMASAVESDIGQMQGIIGLVKRMNRLVDPTEMGLEIADRLREELDYAREARHIALYRLMLAERPDIRPPEPVPELSTKRLLTMSWLEGRPLRTFLDADQETRNRIATLLFHAWWGPMARFGVIHGDPHLGNYTFPEDAASLNLLDFGCVRIFPPRFVQGVINLYRALDANDLDAVKRAYEDWGFGGLNDGAVEALTVWARFIYGPMLEDRVRRVAEGVSPGMYGRREVIDVKTRLAEHGPVTIPREFVFMDRAAIGLGAAFLHLDAEMNFKRLFEAQIEQFELEAVAARQASALAAVGLAADALSG